MDQKTKAYVEWRGGEWKTRVRDAATKKLKWVPLEADLAPADKLTQAQKTEAEALAGALHAAWRRHGFVPCVRDLTINEFFPRWCDSRRDRLPNQVERDETAFRLWIAAELGTLPMRAVTRERLIRFSHWLDTKAADGADFGGKRARNIFSVVAAMFRDAHESKDPTIRILEANPCKDVPWPEMPEGEPLHQLLYPNEFLALVSCPEVPFVRARLYAVTTYTMTRIGEVRMLECKDIDIDNALVKIVKAADNGKGKRGQKKLTKSNRSRLCTLEASLAPLAFAMISERGEGRLFPDRPEEMPQGNQYARQPVDFIPGTSKVCEMFRRDLRAALKWAGIKERPELFDASNLQESQPIRFHDLRASGVTWRHARGDNPTAIRQECGHENERTNDIYTRQLRLLHGAELFPALPDRLLGAKAGAQVGALWARRTPVLPKETVPEEGVERREKQHETPQNKANRDEGLPIVNVVGGGSRMPLGSASDVDQLAALAGAVRDLLRADLVVQARPLVEELARRLDALRGPAAAVVDLDAERAERQT